MNTARDEYIVFSETQCIRCFTSDGVKAAMEEIGRCAVVKRVTDDELARIVTGWFMPSEPDEYQDDIEDWTRKHTRSMARSGAFGTR